MKGGGRVWLTRRAEFSAAHYLTAPGGRAEAVHGDEARRHGHNYLIELTVAGPVDPATGMVVNMSEIKQGIAAFSDLFDHKSLNDDTGFFAGTPPTVEAFASVRTKSGLTARVRWTKSVTASESGVVSRES